MSNALLSIRTDDKTKKEIADFAASVGLSVSAFVTVILKQAVKELNIDILVLNAECKAKGQSETRFLWDLFWATFFVLNYKFCFV